jgi:hypothetical protein
MGEFNKTVGLTPTWSVRKVKNIALTKAQNILAL